MGTVTYFIVLGSKITADSECNHEIKRYLLLGRKTMTNLNNILKSRDITLPVKAHIVKTTVFEVVMDVRVGSQRRLSTEELMVLNCEEDWSSWRRLLRVPWTVGRSNQSVLKEISPEYSLEGLMLKLKLQYLATLCKELTH